MEGLGAGALTATSVANHHGALSKRAFAAAGVGTNAIARVCSKQHEVRNTRRELARPSEDDDIPLRCWQGVRVRRLWGMLETPGLFLQRDERHPRQADRQQTGGSGTGASQCAGSGAPKPARTLAGVAFDGDRRRRDAAHRAPAPRTHRTASTGT